MGVAVVVVIVVVDVGMRRRRRIGDHVIATVARITSGPGCSG